MTVECLTAADLGYSARSDVPFDDLDALDPVPTSEFEHLEGLPPGPMLATVLAGIDRTGLCGYDLVLVMKARQRQISWDQAELFRDMTELGFTPPSDPGDPPTRSDVWFEHTPEEVRCALVWTRRAAETTLGWAFDMMVRFPAVGEALSDGIIDLPRAKVIITAVEGLDEDTANGVIEEILAVAQELTTGQIRSRMSRLCVDADPQAAKKRYEKGVEQRRVVARGRPEGTADITGENLQTDRIAAVMARINETALRLRAGGDSRTMDQIKADLFVELLEGHHHDSDGEGERRAPLVDIRIDLDTLIGLNDRAADIPGWGPVISDIARQAIRRQPNGTWQIVITDPDTGAVKWNGTTRRRPTTTQQRHIQTRQPQCAHPRCRMPAHHSDIDHIQPYAQDGPTTTTNLQPLCRHDHNLKTQGHAQTTQTPTGQTIWTTPHGHQYQQPP